MSIDLKSHIVLFTAILFITLSSALPAQQPPYDQFPEADRPYYRVRYEASDQPGKLTFAVNYTIWIPEDVERIRGVVVHQHGCGEGSCRSGLTGAYDLHWQALASKHDCALLAPSYEQPQDADCQLWCDPRNGSAETFKQCLVDLGKQSGHPELAKVPWALWGHSGGGLWAGGMTLLHPEQVVAAWLRSGVPRFEENPKRPNIQPYTVPDAALKVPMMCNLGTKEGVSNKEGRFASVWPTNEKFFLPLRAIGCPIGVAVDPLTSHECGNQRYLAIRWLDVCLNARLPNKSGEPLRPMPNDSAWLAPLHGEKAVPATEFTGDKSKSIWLPNQSFAQAWMEYVDDTQVSDSTRPPAPFNVQRDGQRLTWEAEADLESGVAYFVILRDGERVGKVPAEPKNRFGRPLFQGLQYSDTPEFPLVSMAFLDEEASEDSSANYRVIAVNTSGLESKPSRAE